MLNNLSADEAVDAIMQKLIDVTSSDGRSETMSKDIFVIVEQRNGAVQKVSYELIGEATKLSADLGEQVVRPAGPQDR